MEPFPELERIRNRSISDEFPLHSRENLRALNIQKKIAEDIVDYAHYQLTVGVERGEISKTASEIIALQMHHTLNDIDKEYDQRTISIQLNTLKANQVNLVQEFNNTVSALDKEIAIVREGLGSYSVDPTRVYSCKSRNVSKFLPLLVIFSLLVLFPYTFGLLSAQHVANSSGIVASVDLVVYQDAECTLVVDAIDWGKVCPGQDVTSVIYVTNTGNVNTTLHFETANWNPAEASGQILVNWDLPFDDLLSPGAIIPIQISLSVSNDIQNIQTFHFDILLTSSPIL